MRFVFKGLIYRDAINPGDIVLKNAITSGWPGPNLRIYQSICLERQRKTIKNLSQRNLCLDLLNLGK
jgi:hypothetical protein